MPNRWDDLRLFWREFRTNFRTTGALLPSGRPLATALARHVRRPSRTTGTASGRRILEAGPGTGAVTQAIIERMGPHDHLDLVEINAAFARRLEERLYRDPLFATVAGRTRVIVSPVEQLAESAAYDVIISGLPLNNFPLPLVEQLLSSFGRMLAPEGVLSFFEYIGVRRAKALVAGNEERVRLSAVGRLLRRHLELHAFRRECVLANVPPAWVHHLQLAAAQAPTAVAQDVRHVAQGQRLRGPSDSRRRRVPPA